MSEDYIMHERNAMNKTHGRGSNITIASLTLPFSSSSSDPSPTPSFHSMDSFLSLLNKQRKEAEEQDALNRAILEASVSKRFTPIRYSSDVPAGKKDVAAALCPNVDCQNVDNRFMLNDDYKAKSSFVVTTTYASSGKDLKCLCCQTEFKFCAENFFHDKKNCIYVPLTFCRDSLEIDISKYVS